MCVIRRERRVFEESKITSAGRRTAWKGSAPRLSRIRTWSCVPLCEGPKRPGELQNTEARIRRGVVGIVKWGRGVPIACDSHHIRLDHLCRHTTPFEHAGSFELPPQPFKPWWFAYQLLYFPSQSALAYHRGRAKLGSAYDPQTRLGAVIDFPFLPLFRHRPTRNSKQQPTRSTPNRPVDRC